MEVISLRLFERIFKRTRQTQLTIGVDSLSVRLALRKDHSQTNILEDGGREHSVVIVSQQAIVVRIMGCVPTLRLYPENGKHLKANNQNQL